jgi:hypothetical protein
MQKFAVIGMLFAVVALGGCGNSATAVSRGQPAAESGIFISSRDCADAGKLTIDQCGQAIDAAVTMHRNQAPSYKSLNACAAVDGPDRCAKDVDGAYRSTVQAFFVTMSKRPSAVPLYASRDGEVGFLGLDKKAFVVNDDDYTMSAGAQAIAHENAKLRKRS